MRVKVREVIVIVLFFVVLACLGASAFTSTKTQSEKPKDDVDGDPGEALYLTDLIESGEIKKARDLALVHHSEMNMTSYSGYLTVNETDNSNLFFWYFPAKANSENAPVILFLGGGPGSSIFYSVFLEIGPFVISPEGVLSERNSSWYLDHNLLYIDSPVGTGYSFTASDDGYSRNNKDVYTNLLKGLWQFFRLFPEYQKNEFFVNGESYAGNFVTAIAYAIFQDSSREDSDPTRPKINLKGYSIGNAWIDPKHQINYADYLYELGLIDSHGQEVFRKYENEIIENIEEKNWMRAFQLYDELLAGTETPQGTVFHNLTGYISYNDNFLNSKAASHNNAASREFVQNNKTRRAIHVGSNTFATHTNGNTVLKYLRGDFMTSVADWMSELLSHYRVLVFTGQLDIIVPYPQVENYLKNLDFDGAEEYKTAKRSIWLDDDDEIAGYVKKAGSLTEVLIRNAGHLAPKDQQEWALVMIRCFTGTGTCPDGWQN